MPVLVIGGVVLGGAVFLALTASIAGVGGLEQKEILGSIGIGAVLGGSVALTFAKISGITKRSTRPFGPGTSA